jgi:molecular chaperone GrpE
MDPTTQKSIFGDLDPLSDPQAAVENAFASAEPQSESSESAEPAEPPAQEPGELEKALGEAAYWKDFATRSVAELENFRKRMAKEKQDAVRFANGSLLETLLPILDNFDFGLQAAKQENEQSTIFVGMSMVYKQLQEFLRDQGVEEIPCVGAAFDPNVQEAVSQQPTADVPEGQVVAQVRRGYRLRERLLRPASVVVACAPQA